MNRYYFYLTACLILCFLSGCRQELPMIRSEVEYVTLPSDPQSVEGFFLVNEGNMGSNKCTIDHFDARTGSYFRNIYPERNPNVVKELGDVGNDIGIYGNRLYVVVNCSNFVEVMNVHTAEHIGSVSIPNCRYIVFNGDKAYVSSYAGPVQIDPNARPGKVVEIDLETLQITREVVVGYQPEEMVINNGRLYVANSGGYRFPNYDRTVSVVDLQSFQVVNTIDVAINLHRMEMDKQGRIYVSSRGDYYGIGSDIYVVDSHTEKVTGRLGIAASEMCMDENLLYTISTEWNYNTGKNQVSYAVYDTEKQEIISRNFIPTERKRKSHYLTELPLIRKPRKYMYATPQTMSLRGIYTVFHRQASSSGKSVPAIFPRILPFRQKDFINQYLNRFKK